MRYVSTSFVIHIHIDRGWSQSHIIFWIFQCLRLCGCFMRWIWHWSSWISFSRKSTSTLASSKFFKAVCRSLSNDLFFDLNLRGHLYNSKICLTQTLFPSPFQTCLKRQNLFLRSVYENLTFHLQLLILKFQLLPLFFWLFKFSLPVHFLQNISQYSLVHKTKLARHLHLALNHIDLIKLSSDLSFVKWLKMHFSVEVTSVHLFSTVYLT